MERPPKYSDYWLAETSLVIIARRSTLPGENSEPLTMQFIEMHGETLMRIIEPDEIPPEDLKAAGVTAQSLVRVNRQGDIELRKRNCWEVIGGLLGDFDRRVKHETGLDWAELE